MTDNPAYGWTSLAGQARKYHYIPEDDDRALCGKWGLSPFVNARDELAHGGGFELGQDDHKDNCAACKKKLAAQS